MYRQFSPFYYINKYARRNIQRNEKNFPGFNKSKFTFVVYYGQSFVRYCL